MFIQWCDAMMQRCNDVMKKWCDDAMMYLSTLWRNAYLDRIIDVRSFVYTEGWCCFDQRFTLMGTSPHNVEDIWSRRWEAFASLSLKTVMVLIIIALFVQYSSCQPYSSYVNRRAHVYVTLHRKHRFKGTQRCDVVRQPLGYPLVTLVNPLKYKMR